MHLDLHHVAQRLTDRPAAGPDPASPPGWCPGFPARQARRRHHLPPVTGNETSPGGLFELIEAIPQGESTTCKRGQLIAARAARPSIALMTSLEVRSPVLRLTCGDVSSGHGRGIAWPGRVTGVHLRRLITGTRGSRNASTSRRRALTRLRFFVIAPDGSRRSASCALLSRGPVTKPPPGTGLRSFLCRPPRV